MRSRLLLAAVAAVLLSATPAAAMLRLPAVLPPVPGNPADRLASRPIEAFSYDAATRCASKPRKGTAALIAWLQANAGGSYWGSYRCEKWGRHSTSLHAENRAIDWHLDVTNAAERREARRLVRLLLAPDALGSPQALARRMGVEELIWDCGYWGAGMADFQPYSVCFSKRGTVRKHVDKTVAHRDHVHIGMTKDGAKGRTSFWG